MLSKIQETVQFIKNIIGNFEPSTGIILGTGLGGLVNEIDVYTSINYEEIPNFPISTVETHSGKLLFGYIEDKHVVCMQGRFHYYEGYGMKEVTFPIGVMQQLGIKKLLVSNASGGMNPAFSESQLMIIEDHISLFLPENPLTGKNDLDGDRFPDMSEPYDKKMIEIAFQIAEEFEIKPLHKGVYVSVTGPNLETKAEYRLLRMLGADAVGMSTVPEVMVARQLDIPVFGISVITDMGIPETLQKAELSKIIAAAAKAEPNMTLIIKELIKRMN